MKLDFIKSDDLNKKIEKSLDKDKDKKKDNSNNLINDIDLTKLSLKERLALKKQSNLENYFIKK